MKRYLIENAKYVHIVLFLLWFSVVITAFIGGTEIFDKEVWIPLVGFVAMLLQICFGVVETDWQQDILDDSGYGKH